MHSFEPLALCHNTQIDTISQYSVCIELLSGTSGGNFDLSVFDEVFVTNCYKVLQAHSIVSGEIQALFAIQRF